MMAEERDPGRDFREGLAARLKATRSPGRGGDEPASGEPLNGLFTKPQTATGDSQDAQTPEERNDG